MSGSGSKGPYERESTKRLRQMLKDPEVKRDPNRAAPIQKELAFRKGNPPGDR